MPPGTIDADGVVDFAASRRVAVACAVKALNEGKVFGGCHKALAHG